MSDYSYKTRKMLAEVEKQQKIIETQMQRQAEQEAMDRLNNLPGAKVQMMIEMMEQGILTQDNVMDWLNAPVVNIETKVQSIKVNGEEVLEWVV